MRFQELVLEEGSAQVSLTFHPRLTVIAGLGHAEREGITGELLGVMGGARRDSRLDLVDDTGRHLSVRRADAPERDKVVNNDNAHEVSLEFLDGGRIDLLHTLDLNPGQARRRCRLSAADFSAVIRGEALVASLATRNQDQLWAGAERVRAADLKLAAESEPETLTTDDVDAVEDIERCHAVFEATKSRHETIRQHGLFVAGVCALAAGTAAVEQSLVALPFLVVALLTTWVAVLSRRRMEAARLLEGKALAAAGATSYVAFHMLRIAARLDRHDDTPARKAAAAEEREASAAWQTFAGGVSADWAFAMREQIVSAAKHLDDRRRDPSRSRPVPSDPDGGDPGQPSPAELAEVLMVRLADLRHVGSEGESVPLILDEPLAGVDLPVKQWMLELVGRTAGMPQVVYLTEDPDVAAWARIEALAGQLDVIESRPAVDQT